MYDVIIIGAGVTGASVARELSAYRVKACVLERAEDVCCGTSKANSGIVHAGYDAVPGTLKAKLNLLGNARMEILAKELDIPFQRKGSLVICNQKEDLPKLQELYDRGQENNVQGLQIIDGAKLHELEPNAADTAIAALYAPTAGIVCPFELNIAMAENAYMNGIPFRFHTEVEQIEKRSDRYVLHTTKGDFESRCVVNAAGVYADQFHNMVSESKLHITARRGEYCLLDKTAGSHISRTIFALPGSMGKGVLVTPTVHGNLLVGPTAWDVEQKEETNTTKQGLDTILGKAGQNVKNLPMKQVITSFAGLRAHEAGDDFIIGEPEDAKGFMDCAGMESPGLTASPAVGCMVAEQLRNMLELQENPEFIKERKKILNPFSLPEEKRNAWIKEHPAYGRIVCRCEMVSEGEIVDAVTRPLGARTLDGVKRRTRAGAGRCQAGFCTPRVMEILARTWKIPLTEVRKSGAQSQMVCGKNKEAWQEVWEK